MVAQDRAGRLVANLRKVQLGRPMTIQLRLKEFNPASEWSP